MNFSLDRELCTNLWCHCHQTSHGINILNNTADILGGVDGQAAERHGRPIVWADDWMGGCMWPGHRALSYYLMSASTRNEDLGERCLHGTGICSQQYRSFISQWVAICDPWRSEWWIAIHDTWSENCDITNCRPHNLCSSHYFILPMTDRDIVKPIQCSQGDNRPVMAVTGDV